MQNFKELLVWQKAHKVVLEIYGVAEGFPKTEIYGLTSQLRRSIVSVSANIAEGCGKKSQADIANFFQISLGSPLHESEYYMLLAKDLNFIHNETYTAMDLKLREIKAMLVSLIKKTREPQAHQLINS